MKLLPAPQPKAKQNVSASATHRGRCSVPPSTRAELSIGWKEDDLAKQSQQLICFQSLGRRVAVQRRTNNALRGGILGIGSTPARLLQRRPSAACVRDIKKTGRWLAPGRELPANSAGLSRTVRSRTRLTLHRTASCRQTVHCSPACAVPGSTCVRWASYTSRHYTGCG